MIKTMYPHIVLTCTAFLLYSANSFSAPPVAFGSGGCPSGFVCETNVTSLGMEQRILTDGQGTQYIQVTVTEGVVNGVGKFDYESFVNGSNGNLQGGISAKLDILQSGQFNIDYSTTLNIGWANTGGPAIDIQHNVTDQFDGINFEQNFNYLQNQNNNGSVTGYSYGIRETVIGAGAKSGGGTQTFVLKRAGGDFVNNGSASLSGTGGGMMRRKANAGGQASSNTNTYQSANFSTFGTDGATAANNASGTASTGNPQTLPVIGSVFGPDGNSAVFNGVVPDNLDANTLSNNQNISSTGTRNIGSSTGEITSNGVASGADAPTSEVYVATGNSGGMGMGGSGGPSGGTVTWNTGDEVQVLWIGQDCPSCVVSGGMMGGGGNGQFSFQQYENINTGVTASSRSISSSAPLNWLTDPFGAQPGL